MFKSNRDYKLYIEDIASECKNIRLFTKDTTYDEFTENLEKVYAVAKAFENIGEAVKNIPSKITNEYPQIPWSEIAKMRDVLTHHYFGVIYFFTNYQYKLIQVYTVFYQNVWLL